MQTEEQPKEANRAKMAMAQSQREIRRLRTENEALLDFARDVSREDAELSDLASRARALLRRFT